MLRIPAYSGKHINTMVGIDPNGRIVGLSIVQHDEPILAVGITQEKLNRYVAQYEGKSAYDRITIGAERKGYVAIDGITGATITVMVQNATVMRSAKLVAEARGIRNPGVAEATGGAESAAGRSAGGVAPGSESAAIRPEAGRQTPPWFMVRFPSRATCRCSFRQGRAHGRSSRKNRPGSPYGRTAHLISQFL
ncbi:MAG: FMN-binding protein [Rhodocyclaceae bacterium]|nr:FMN-binding protein [Rhodocyclaceae bacterium]